MTFRPHFSAGVLVRDPTRMVTGLGDGAYYYGADGSGLQQLGCVHVALKVISLPGGSTARAIAGRVNADGKGWILYAVGNDLVAYVYETGGVGYVTTPVYTLDGGDVDRQGDAGKILNVYITCDAGVGGIARLFVGGPEVGTAIPIATAVGHDADIASFQVYQAAAVATAFGEGKACYFVDHALNNTTHLTADGIHLSDAGNVQLASDVNAVLVAEDIV